MKNAVYCIASTEPQANDISHCSLNTRAVHGASCGATYV